MAGRGEHRRVEPKHVHVVTPPEKKQNNRGMCGECFFLFGSKTGLALRPGGVVVVSPCLPLSLPR